MISSPALAERLVRTPTPPPTLLGLAPTDMPFPLTIELSSDQDKSLSMAPSRGEDDDAAPALPNPFPDAAAANSGGVRRTVICAVLTVGEKAADWPAMQNTTITHTWSKTGLRSSASAVIVGWPVCIYLPVCLVSAWAWVKMIWECAVKDRRFGARSRSRECKSAKGSGAGINWGHNYLFSDHFTSCTSS